MPEYGRDWYENAETYWHELAGTDFLIPAETEQVYPLFIDFLRDVDSGRAPEQSLAFWEMLDYLGMSYDQFDWDDFREWYDAQ